MYLEDPLAAGYQGCYQDTDFAVQGAPRRGPTVLLRQQPAPPGIDTGYTLTPGAAAGRQGGGNEHVHE